MIWMIAGSLASALSGLLIFVYFLQKGQFQHLEETKYQLFHEEEEEKDA